MPVQAAAALSAAGRRARAVVLYGDPVHGEELMTQTITFSFGRNWQDYLSTVSDDAIALAEADIDQFLGKGAVRNKTVLDIGSGSGLHSLAFLRLGAKAVRSFDADPHSVGATGALRRRAGDPGNWIVEQGSILDDDYVASLGRYDIVYSWGVLHHTGAMWQALGNAMSLVRPGGTLWISLYQKGPRYEQDLALKQRYNAASPIGKRMMEYRRIARLMLGRARRLQNPFAWNQKVKRGMNVLHDIRDWLGGLPYETATADEVVTRTRAHGLVLERIAVAGQGGCSVYVFSLPTPEQHARGRKAAPGRTSSVG